MKRLLPLAFLLGACVEPRALPRLTDSGIDDSATAEDASEDVAVPPFDGPSAETDKVDAPSDTQPPDVPAATDAPGDTAPPSEAGAMKLANGATCSAGSACATGFCVDGVCCDNACDGQCEACAQQANKGKCVAVTGPAVGSRPACAGQGVCAAVCNGSSRVACSYPAAEKTCAMASCQNNTAYSSSVCDGKGACLPQTTVACTGTNGCSGNICAGGCSASNPCPTDQFCSAGKCFAKLALGSTCTAADACQSGKCADAVCCDAACDNPCQTCNASGHCVTVISADDDRCTGGGKTCDAAGTCITKKALGIGCSDGTQCVSGRCIDGVCCDRACSGQCEFCNRAGAAGTCGFVGGVPQGGRGSCPGSGECASICDGSGPSCKFPTGACGSTTCSGTTFTPRGTCNGSGSCTAASSINCGNYTCQTSGCRTTCNTGSDCAPGLACSGAGGNCSMPSMGTWQLQSGNFQTVAWDTTTMPTGTCSPKGASKTLLIAQMPMGSQVGFTHNATFDTIHCGPGQWNYDSVKCRECGGSLVIDNCMQGWSRCYPVGSADPKWFSDTQPGSPEDGCRTDLKVIAQIYTCK